MHFPHLNESSRRQIWKTFLARTPSAGNITDEEIDTLAKETMNGRQVRVQAQFFLRACPHS